MSCFSSTSWRCYLTRLVARRVADQFVLKGGILLAAFGERRPTRDVDLQAQDLDNDADEVRSAVCEIASIELDDGIIFDVDAASAEVIRDEDAYAGMRVSMSAQLATARPHFHVDVSVGDPISPPPGEHPVARLRESHLISRHHPIDGDELTASVSDVADHRHVELASLAQVLDGYGDIGQQRWAAWRRKQRLDDRLPSSFDDVVRAVIAFADPAIAGAAVSGSWNPAHGAWSSRLRYAPSDARRSSHGA